MAKETKVSVVEKITKRVKKTEIVKGVRKTVYVTTEKFVIEMDGVKYLVGVENLENNMKELDYKQNIIKLQLDVIKRFTEK